jgi:hypothetical protein
MIASLSLYSPMPFSSGDKAVMKSLIQLVLYRRKSNIAAKKSVRLIRQDRSPLEGRDGLVQA